MESQAFLSMGEEHSRSQGNTSNGLENYGSQELEHTRNIKSSPSGGDMISFVGLPSISRHANQKVLIRMQLKNQINENQSFLCMCIPRAENEEQREATS